MIDRTPFVGRQHELEHVARSVESGHGRVFVLCGPAGVGKTRLASEVSARLARHGLRPLRVTATAAASRIPFGALAPILAEEDLVGEDLSASLRRATAAVLERQNGESAGMILTVDDAHLLDDGSATLVHQLALTGACRMVLTVRTGLPAPDAVTAIWKDGLAERIDLGPIDEATTAELARGALDGPVSGGALKWLWASSAGNPLYARELLIGATESGALVERNGLWLLEQEPPPPGRLAELIESRLDALGEGAAEVVDFLSLAEPLESELIERLTSPSAVEEAERAGVVAHRVTGLRSEALLGHPVFGEVGRRRIPRSRARKMSALMADALEATGARRRDDVLRLARWRLDAGRGGDPEMFARAASLARAMFARNLAARFARACIEAGGGVEPALTLAEAEFFSGNHDVAETILASVVPLCRTDAETAVIASARAYNLGFLKGDKPAAEAIVAAALDQVSEPEARLRLRGRLSTMRIYSGELEAGLADALELMASTDESIRHRGMAMASVGLAMTGRGDEAVETARLGLASYAAAPDRNQPPEAQLVGSALGHLVAGRLGTALAEARTGYDHNLARGDDDGVATFSLVLGMIEMERGAVGPASRAFREGWSVTERISDPGPLRWCIAGAALADALLGRADEAGRSIARLDSLPEHWMLCFDHLIVQRARAWARAVAGELSTARDLLWEASVSARAGPDRLGAMVLLHDLARLGDPRRASGPLADLCRWVEGPYCPTLADSAAAMAARSAPELEKVAGRFEELGALLLAAESARRAAQAYREAGLPRAASHCDLQAERLADACPGAWSPALAAGAAPVRLTRRENEVAVLAALGATSRDIADRLCVSVRTVENHLQNVYTKLGISGRDQLATALKN